MIRPELIAMGASWGGIDALRAILGPLPERLPVAIVLVQHRGRDDSDGLLEVLRRSTQLEVREPVDKEPILPGCVYLAPADYHLLVERRSFALTTDGPVNWARPSVDVLFDSAALAFGERLIAMVLSGAGHDGAEGIARVKAHRGVTVVQDPLTAQIPAMPMAAVKLGRPDHVLPLAKIAPFILERCGLLTPALSA